MLTNSFWIAVAGNSVVWLMCECGYDTVAGGVSLAPYNLSAALARKKPRFCPVVVLGNMAGDLSR